MTVLSRLVEGFEVQLDSVVRHVQLMKGEGGGMAVKVTDTRRNEYISDRVCGCVVSICLKAWYACVYSCIMLSAFCCTVWLRLSVCVCVHVQKSWVTCVCVCSYGYLCSCA